MQQEEDLILKIIFDIISDFDKYVTIKSQNIWKNEEEKAMCPLLTYSLNFAKKSFLVMIKATNILFGQFGMYIYVYEWSFKDD